MSNEYDRDEEPEIEGFAVPFGIPADENEPKLSDEEKAEIRSMILSLLATLVREAVDKIESVELESGSLESHQMVRDVEWHLQVAYNSADQLIACTAHPHHRGPRGLIAAVFGVVDEDGKMSFVLPRAWMPKVEVPE